MNIESILRTATVFFGLVIGAASLALSTVANAQASSENSNGVPAHQDNTHELVEILPSDFKPAFTRATVVKLNSIVERAYTTIAEFDDLKKQIRKSNINNVGAKTSMAVNENQLASIRSLESQSNLALTDMSAAVEELKASQEHYNTAVLAGMVIFVTRVDEEIAQFYEKSSSP